MDVRYINPFVLAIKNVFGTMLSTDVNIDKPMLKSNDEDLTADVSAVIGLAGDAVGAVALCFPTESANQIASKFACMELTQAHEDFADALGELANMVAGQAKAKLDGLNCTISLPSVIIGKQHIVSNSKNSPRIVFPCNSDLGHFSVEVGMVVEKKQNTAGATAVAAGA